MLRLEDIQPGAAIRGVTPSNLATVVNVQWHGSDVIELTHKDAQGRLANELLFRHDEPRVEIVEEGRPWSFDANGKLLRLVSEAQRIRAPSPLETRKFKFSCSADAGRADGLKLAVGAARQWQLSTLAAFCTN